MVSVCIPVVSDHGLIDGCLDSLVDSRPSVDTEVVVVANGLSGDGLASLQKRDDIVLVRSAVNTGFSGGNNLAARFARGRYLLLLNDDSLVEAGFIDRLLKAMEREPSDRRGGRENPLGRRHAPRGGLGALERRLGGACRSWASR